MVRIQVMRSFSSQISNDQCMDGSLVRKIGLYFKFSNYFTEFECNGIDRTDGIEFISHQIPIKRVQVFIYLLTRKGSKHKHKNNKNFCSACVCLFLCLRCARAHYVYVRALANNVMLEKIAIKRNQKFKRFKFCSCCARQ